MPVIIDGHNLIGKMSGISLADPNDEDKLVKILARHLLTRRAKVVVVFDKGSDTNLAPRQVSPKLQVVFAAPESSADAIIIDMIKSDPNPKGLTIVSSDNEIRRCARSRRAKLISAGDFARQLESDPSPRRRRGPSRHEIEDIDVADWYDYFKKGNN